VRGARAKKKKKKTAKKKFNASSNESANATIERNTHLKTKTVKFDDTAALERNLELKEPAERQPRGSAHVGAGNGFALAAFGKPRQTIFIHFQNTQSLKGMKKRGESVERVDVVAFSFSFFFTLSSLQLIVLLMKCFRIDKRFRRLSPRLPRDPPHSFVNFVSSVEQWRPPHPAPLRPRSSRPL
jgi:hypothetical protein